MITVVSSRMFYNLCDVEVMYCRKEDTLGHAMLVKLLRHLVLAGIKIGSNLQHMQM